MRRSVGLLCIAAIACQRAPDSPTLAACVRGVYTEALSYAPLRVGLFGGAARLIVVEQRASTHGSVDDKDGIGGWAYLKRGLPALRRETYDDFWDRNEGYPEVQLPDQLDIRVQVVRWGDSENGGLEKLREDFPSSSGLVEMSMPGFNGERTQALLLIGQAIHGTGAWRSYFLMTRSERHWKIEQEFKVSVS